MHLMKSSIVMVFRDAVIVLELVIAISYCICGVRTMILVRVPSNFVSRSTVLLVENALSAIPCVKTIAGYYCILAVRYYSDVIIDLKKKPLEQALFNALQRSFIQPFSSMLTRRY